ncbi:MAG TPA: tetratricopeptide repeat protein [Spirochaetia bacterium]|nr:tetratricopeptide repeat protein [Spirochaetia bacterium]
MELNQSDQKFIEAMSFQLSGDWKNAEKAFVGLTEKYPENHFLYFLLGTNCYSQGKLNTAIDHFRKSIYLKPDFGNAYYELGVCQYRVGKLQHALESFTKVGELKNQSHAMALYYVGLINFMLGQDAAASDAFARFREVSPESRIANFYLGQLKLKRNEFADALEPLNQLVEETPHFAEVQYMLGVAHYGLHNNMEAIRHFRRALDINPNDQRSKTRLALLTDTPWS